jgi:D-alanyl-D-alanine dipeptidase
MKLKILYALLILTSLFLPQIAHTGTGNEKMPDGFVDIQKIIPEVILDIRYYGQHNFLGERVDGYMAPKCFLTK